jgi:hypothetical protein
MHISLPLDIIHIILCSLPDLRTLNSTIKVSKRVYRIFEAHPNVIRAAVARTEAGLTLIQACRLVMACRLYPNRGQGTSLGWKQSMRDFRARFGRM